MSERDDAKGTPEGDETVVIPRGRQGAGHEGGVPAGGPASDGVGVAGDQAEPSGMFAPSAAAPEPDEEPGSTVRMPRPARAPVEPRAGSTGPIPVASPSPHPSGEDPFAASRGRATVPARRHNPYAVLSLVLALALVAVIAFMAGSCAAGTDASVAEPSASGLRGESSSSGGRTSGAPSTGRSDSNGSSEEDAMTDDGTLGSLANDIADKIGSVNVDDLAQGIQDLGQSLQDGAQDLAGDAADLLNSYANS